MKIHLVILIYFGLLDSVRAFKTESEAKVLYDKWRCLEDSELVKVYLKEIELEA